MKTRSSTSAINKAAMPTQVPLRRVCSSGRPAGSAEAGRSSTTNDSEGSGGRGLSVGLFADTLAVLPRAIALYSANLGSLEPLPPGETAGGGLATGRPGASPESQSGFTHDAGPRSQAGQTLRRRFAQKPDEDEGSGVFALTISWSSASRLFRSRYPSRRPHRPHQRLLRSCRTHRPCRPSTAPGYRLFLSREGRFAGGH